MLASPQSLVEGLTPAGAQAAAVARVLALPVKDLSVSGLMFDVEVQLSPQYYFESIINGPIPDANQMLLQLGLAVYTQRLDETGSPVDLPVYDLSQWPVNATTGFTDAQEDNDYATRTHYHRAFALVPHTVYNIASGDPGDNIVVPGYPHYRFSVRCKVGRRISDNYGLFLGTWLRTPSPSWLEAASSVFWRITGSMWYKLRM